jgi:UDPglucose 6-dehydrogenase
MAYMGKFNGIDLSLIETTIKGNERRKINMAKRILDMVEDIKTPTIAVLGSAFKGGTDDCRESPALQIIEIMLAHDVNIKLYDPEAMPNTKAILGDLITYCDSAYEAIGGADVLAVLTDLQEFKSLELEKIKVLMTRPQIADFRNNFDYNKAKELGFEIKSLGRK